MGCNRMSAHISTFSSYREDMAKMLPNSSRGWHINDKDDWALALLIECKQIVSRVIEESELLMNRMCRTLDRCNLEVLCAIGESELMNEICRIIVKVGGYRMAWVGLTDENKDKTMQPVLKAGYGEDYPRLCVKFVF